MLSKGLFLIFPLAASGFALGGETVVPVKATPTAEPMRVASAGTGLTGSHANVGTQRHLLGRTHVPTSSALQLQSMAGYGMTPGLGGMPAFGQMTGMGNMSVLGSGFPGIMPLGGAVGWGMMPSMMMPMDMGGAGFEAGMIDPVIPSELPSLTGMPLLAATPMLNVPLGVPSTSIMAQAMGVWSPGTPGMTDLQSISMFAVTPAEPRLYHIHDLVQIIVREASVAASFQGLETEKEYGLAGGVESFPGVNGDNPLYYTEFDVVGEKEFDGEGEYVREDELVTRLSAEVIEIRPNGNLVLEARTRIRTDDEEWYTQLTGTCRPEDITAANTILSNQIFDLQVEKRHKGSVPKAASKGILAQALDAIFAF